MSDIESCLLQVDPLFHKMSAAFDEGGSGGLLLNHLSCLDDTSELYLDSSTVVPGFDEPRESDEVASARSMVDLKEFRGMSWGQISLVFVIALVSILILFSQKYFQ